MIERIIFSLFSSKLKSETTLFTNPNNGCAPVLSLPNDVISHIGTFLGNKSLGRLSRACKQSHGLFQKSLNRHRHLLHHVFGADEDQANTLLLKLKMSNPNYYWQLILERGKGSEHCGREWEAVSPLEFAAWAGDTFMVEMLLSHISDEFKHLALKQLRSVKEKGTEHGPHLSYLKPVINAYTEYDSRCDSVHRSQRLKYFIVKIGGSQKKYLPVYVLQEFCGPVPFYPVPEFKRVPVRSCLLPDGSSLLPYSASSGLGVQFALYKGSKVRCIGGPEDEWISLFAKYIEYIELPALRRFRLVRTEDLVMQISRLEQLEQELKTRAGITPNIRPNR